jgi:hypothetical protein
VAHRDSSRRPAQVVCACACACACAGKEKTVWFVNQPTTKKQKVVTVNEQLKRSRRVNVVKGGGGGLTRGDGMIRGWWPSVSRLAWSEAFFSVNFSLQSHEYTLLIGRPTQLCSISRPAPDDAYIGTTNPSSSGGKTLAGLLVATPHIPRCRSVTGIGEEREMPCPNSSRHPSKGGPTYMLAEA